MAAEPDSRVAPADRSLQWDLRQLADEASGYAKAEIAFQKSRVRFSIGQVPGIAIFGIVAFLFVFFALGGLVVGLIIALAPLLTAWGSMAAVVVTLLVGAALCLLIAWRKWKRLVAVFSGGDDE